MVHIPSQHDVGKDQATPACVIQHDGVAPTPHSEGCLGRSGRDELVVRRGARAVGRDRTARHAVATGIARSRATVTVGRGDGAPHGGRPWELAVAGRSGAVGVRAGRAGRDRHNDGRIVTTLRLRALPRRGAAARRVCPGPVQGGAVGERRLRAGARGVPPQLRPAGFTRLQAYYSDPSFQQPWNIMPARRCAVLAYEGLQITSAGPRRWLAWLSLHPVLFDCHVFLAYA